MIEIARKFADAKKAKFGNMRVLMTLDNLAAHCTKEVKRIYKEGNALLCYLLKETTGSLQMIGIGYGRSVRCSMGRTLDN